MNLSIQISKIEELNAPSSLLFLCHNAAILKDFGFDQAQIDYFSKSLDDKSFAATHRHPNLVGVVKISDKPLGNTDIEKVRNDGAKMVQRMNDEKLDKLCVFDLTNNAQATLALLDGLVAASYSFNKYKSQKAPLTAGLQTIHVVSPAVNQTQLDELSVLWAANFLARHLVNETPAALSAENLAEAAVQAGAQTGFKTKVYNKAQIESMGFGGLLAVNQGSVNPPTFTLMEWKPTNAKNAQPIVLVGKGVVYDTGGINLKTMPGSLDDMKCDMAGAAAVIGTMAAVAANNLPVYVIGLVPATDNRPGFNAYVPGDVITMHSGATVEVMNTDAEGRLILADALSFAKSLNPQLVIDLATLTGSAVMAIGAFGTVAMGTADDATKAALSAAGEVTGERLAWFPFWDEYDDLIKSDVADMKNIGGREAGSITAGKFLARFTDYPWVHLDIAGPAFLNKPIGYRQIGATGVGIRLLYGFLKGE
jgi:leucyl aminopeptidase